MRKLKKAIRQATARDVYVTFPVKSKRQVHKVELYLRNQGYTLSKECRHWINAGDPHIIVWQYCKVAELHTHDCWSCLHKQNPPFKIHPSSL